MEIWKNIQSYELLYQVSSLGRVKSLNYNRSGKEKICKNTKHPSGYLVIGLANNKIFKTYRIHRLVAQAFLGLDINNSKICVCHKDDNPLNNNVDNLFLGSRKDNNVDRTLKGRGNKGKYHLYISKQINQYDKQGNFIKTRNGCREIERNIGVFNSNIIQCCKGKVKTAGGFIWKYN